MLSLLNTTFTTAVRGGVSLVSEILSKLTSRADVIESEDCVKEALRGATARNASFALIPSAYSDGIVHAALPDDGSGDLDFSRVNPAGGTRINSQGVIEKVSLLGDELVTNGTFETVLGNDVFNPNVFYGNPNSVTDGVYEVTVLNTGRGFQMSLLSFELGVDYKIEWEVIETTLTAGVFAVWNGAGGDTTYFGDLTQVGNTGTIYKEGIATQNGDIRGNNLSTGTIKFRLTVKEVIEGYIDDTELITNGGFDTGSGWILGTGWSIEDGVAKQDGTGNGSSLQQNNILVVGKTYKIEYEIIDTAPQGSIQVFAGYPNSNAPNDNTVGVHTHYIKAEGNSNLYLKPNVFTGSIDNISVKEVVQDNWSLGSWAIANGVASSGNTSSLLVQENVYTNSSATYRTTFRARSIDGSSASLRVYDGSGNGYSTLTITSIDFEDFKITRQKAGGDNKLYFYNNSNKQLEIDNVSVKKVIEEGVPRIDHTGGGCPSLLLEPQSTNLLPYSEDFSGYSKGSNTTLTYESDIIAPDGSLGVYRLQNPATASTALILIGATSNNISIWAKAVTQNSNNKFTMGGSAEVSDLFTTTNQWQRFDYTFSSNSSRGHYINNSGDTFASDIYIWGAQIETLPYASSYIPTSGGIATRSAETLGRDNISHLINSEEGVFYFEFKPNSTDTSTFSLSDGSSSNFVQIYVQPSTSNLRYRASSSGSVQFDNNLATSTDLSLNNKYALKWGLNNYSLWVNGIEFHSQTTGSTPIGMSKLNFESVFSGLQKVNGNIKDLRIYKSIEEAQKDLTYIN